MAVEGWSYVHLILTWKWKVRNLSLFLRPRACLSFALAEHFSLLVCLLLNVAFALISFHWVRFSTGLITECMHMLLFCPLLLSATKECSSSKQLCVLCSDYMLQTLYCLFHCNHYHYHQIHLRRRMLQYLIPHAIP